MSDSGAGTGDERLDRGTLIALAAMSLGVFLVANDFTALSVALPDIERDFDSAPPGGRDDGDVTAGADRDPDHDERAGDRDPAGNVDDDQRGAERVHHRPTADDPGRRGRGAARGAGARIGSRAVRDHHLARSPPLVEVAPDRVLQRAAEQPIVMTVDDADLVLFEGESVLVFLTRDEADVGSPYRLVRSDGLFTLTDGVITGGEAGRPVDELLGLTIDEVAELIGN